MAKMKKKIPSRLQGCGGNYSLTGTGGGVNQYNYFGKWFGVASKAECMHVLYAPKLHSWMYTPQNCAHVLKKQTNIY